MPRFKYEPSDYEQVSQYLALAAELSSSRPMSAAAVKHLIGLLAEEIPAQAAIAVLCDWPKRHDKAPTVQGVLKSARDLLERQQELRRASVRDDPSVPKVGDVKPADPDMADAVDRAMKAIFALGPRPDAFWEWEGIAHLDTINFTKRRFLEEKYGDRLKDPDFVRGIKDKVRNRIYLEQQLPKPSDLLIRKQDAKADAWEYGA